MTLGRVSEEWVWVSTIDRFIRRSDRSQWPRRPWARLHSHLGGHVLMRVWKDSIPVRKFVECGWWPGRPEFPGGERYNLWRPGDEAPPRWKPKITTRGPFVS
jgi:hypothetical protein